MLRASLIAIALCCGHAAHADVLNLPSQRDASSSTVTLPQRGEHMSAVQAQFGTPAKRFAPVGGGKPQHPPITRWDYANFSVFFEREWVIDAVVKDSPAPLRNTEALRSGP